MDGKALKGKNSGKEMPVKLNVSRIHLFWQVTGEQTHYVPPLFMLWRVYLLRKNRL